MNKSSISKKQCNQFVEYAVKRGYISDKSLLNLASRVEDFVKRGSYYHSTDAVLKLYPILIKKLKLIEEKLLDDNGYSSMEELKSELETVSNREDFFDSFVNMRQAYRYTEYEKTLFLLERVDDSLAILKDTDDGERMHMIINDRYLTAKPLTWQEIRANLNCSRGTYYNLHNKAVDILSAILWTAPDAQADEFLEALRIVSLKRSVFSSDS